MGKRRPPKREVSRMSVDGDRTGEVRRDVESAGRGAGGQRGRRRGMAIRRRPANGREDRPYEALKPPQDPVAMDARRAAALTRLSADLGPGLADAILGLVKVRAPLEI